MRKYASKVRAAGGRRWADVGQRSNRGAIRNGQHMPGEGTRSMYQQGMDAYVEGKGLHVNSDRRMVAGWRAGLESDKQFIEQLLQAGKNADKAIDRVAKAMQIQAESYYKAA